jgi:methyl-accepting chemotaxis protein
MNNERRKKIQNVVDQLQQLSSTVEDIKDTEQEAFDAMPESLQGGTKGEQSQEAIDAMADAESELDSAITSIENAIGALDLAQS